MNATRNVPESVGRGLIRVDPVKLAALNAATEWAKASAHSRPSPPMCVDAAKVFERYLRS